MTVREAWFGVGFISAIIAVVTVWWFWTSWVWYASRRKKE